LSNKNKNDIVSRSKKFSDLNKALITLLHNLDPPLFCSSILSYLLPPILLCPLLFHSYAATSQRKIEEEKVMTGFLVVALLSCLLKDGAYKAMGWDDADFFSNCPPSRCSKHGPEIRYPFRLESSNASSLCGAPCLKLGCYGDDTILVLPTAVIQYKVTAIDYRRGTLTLAPRVDESSSSCKQKLMSVSLPRNVFKCEDPDPCSLMLCYHGYATIVSCLREFIPSNLAANFIFGPISCLSSASQFSYLVDGYASMSLLPLDCKVVPHINFLKSTPTVGSTFKEQAETILDFSGTTAISWDYVAAPYYCTPCERGGGRCGFSPDRNQTICMNQGIISNWAKPYSHMFLSYLTFRDKNGTDIFQPYLRPNSFRGV